MKKFDAYKIITAPPKKIEWRVGSKTKDGSKVQVLPYIDARAAMDILDEVALYAWNSEVRTDKEGVICRLRIVFDDGEAVREEGAGYPVGEDDKLASDMRLKGAVSDAFKRAVHAMGYARQLYGLQKVYIPAATPIYKFIVDRIDWETGRVHYHIGGEQQYQSQNEANTVKTEQKPQVVQSKPQEVPQQAETVAENKVNPVDIKNQDYYTCDGCNKKISEKVAKFSLQRYKKHLCMNCQSEAAKTA